MYIRRIREAARSRLGKRSKRWIYQVRTLPEIGWLFHWPMRSVNAEDAVQEGAKRQRRVYEDCCDTVNQGRLAERHRRRHLMSMYMLCKVRPRTLTCYSVMVLCHFDLAQPSSGIAASVEA